MVGGVEHAKHAHQKMKLLYSNVYKPFSYFSEILLIVLFA